MSRAGLSSDALLVCAQIWLGAHLMLSNPYAPQPFRDLGRPEVRALLPGWLPLPAATGAPLGDPIVLLLAGLAVGASLIYAMADLALEPGRARGLIKRGGLALALLALLLVPCGLEMALGQLHGAAWHGHDGGVLQTDQASDLLLDGVNPYVFDYHSTPQGQQSEKSGFWRRLGGNPALYHLPYLPGCFVLPLPLRPLLRAAVGFYDPRMFYLACYALAVASVAGLRGAHRATAVAGVALCPLLLPYLVEGRNDVLVLGPLLGMAWCLQRERVREAMLLWGLACSCKQFAWLYAPFFGVYLARRRQLGLLGWAALPFALLVLPFLAWDAGAFLDDTLRFMEGGSPHPYPFGGTPGLGWANVLLAGGAVPDLLAPYSFTGWQLCFGAPLLLAGCRRLWQEPDWRQALASGTLFAAVYLWASRVLHANYLGLFLPLLLIASTSDRDAKE